MVIRVPRAGEPKFFDAWLLGSEHDNRRHQTERRSDEGERTESENAAHECAEGWHKQRLPQRHMTHEEQPENRSNEASKTSSDHRDCCDVTREGWVPTDSEDKHAYQRATCGHCPKASSIRTPKKGVHGTGDSSEWWGTVMSVGARSSMSGCVSGGA
jgi:hypothetical protein